MESKLFKIVRSNTVVAYGCIFPSGKCVIAWEGSHKSVVVWDSFEDVKKVNGHPGTEFLF